MNLEALLAIKPEYPEFVYPSEFVKEMMKRLNGVNELHQFNGIGTPDGLVCGACLKVLPCPTQKIISGSV